MTPREEGLNLIQEFLLLLDEVKSIRTEEDKQLLKNKFKDLDKRIKEFRKVHPDV